MEEILPRGRVGTSERGEMLGKRGRRVVNAVQKNVYTYK
jgi:hypothetical protein